MRGSTAEAAGRWEVPAIEETAVQELRGAAGQSAHLLTAGQLDSLQQRVRQEAWAEGHAEGVAAGRAQIEQRGQQLDQLLTVLAAPFQALDEGVEESLAQLAVALACRILRREISVDANEMLPIISEAVTHLPINVREIVVHLNAADKEVLQDSLPADSNRRWRLQADDSLARGDLRIVTPHAEIDGRLAVRLEAMLAAGEVARAEIDAEAE